MRIFSIVAISLVLAACGQKGHQTNNAASNEIAPVAVAVTNTDLAMFSPAPKDAAHKIMHDRHEGMEGIGKANKIIKQELNASSPNLGLVRYSASKMASLSQDASGWFHAGTGPELGKTGAKPEIWQNKSDVAAKLAAFQKAIQAFEVTTRGSDINAMKAGFASLSDTCKACHDKYRSQMHH